MFNLAVELEPIYIEYKIDNFEIKEGENRFVAVAFTEKYVPRKFLEQYHTTLNNKAIRFRHIDPESDADSFLGTVIETWVKDGEMFMVGQLETDTNFQQHVWEDIKKKKLHSVSVGLIKTVNEKKELQKIHFLEASVTPSPKCKECKILITQKMGEEKIMGEDNKTVDPKVYEDRHNQAQELIKKQKQELDVFQIAVDEIAKENKNLVSGMEEKVKQISELNEQVGKLNSELTVQKALPKRLELLKYEGIDPNSDSGKTRLVELEKFDPSIVDSHIATAKRIIEATKHGVSNFTSIPTPQFADNSASYSSAAKFEEKIKNMTPEEVVKATDEYIDKMGGQ